MTGQSLERVPKDVPAEPKAEKEKSEVVACLSKEGKGHLPSKVSQASAQEGKGKGEKTLPRREEQLTPHLGKRSKE